MKHFSHLPSFLHFHLVKTCSCGFSIKSWPNGLSDHDAQILTLNDIKMYKFPACNFTRRIINDSTLLDFQLNLSYESWDNVLIALMLIPYLTIFLTPILEYFITLFHFKKVITVTILNHG